MAIDYNTDIVTGFFASDVATETAYQSPGDFGLPATFGNSAGEQRILTFVEVMRAFMAQIGSVQEAKLLHEIMARMMSEFHMGGVAWNTTTMPANAQRAAMQFIAKHNVPTTI